MGIITVRIKVLTVLLLFSAISEHTARSPEATGTTDCHNVANLAGQNGAAGGGRDNCPASNFRVFNGPDLEVLENRLPPDGQERLAFAARRGESNIVMLTRSSQLGIAQEGARINIDCLPWLSRFPNGSIQWYTLSLDYPDFGKCCLSLLDLSTGY